MGEKKQRVAVIFGGQSSEHEVSCKSAVTVISHIDRTKYEPVLIGITKEGCWLKVEDTEAIRNDTWRENGKRALPIWQFFHRMPENMEFSCWGILWRRSR